MPLPDSLHREMVYSRLGSATFSYGIAKARLSGILLSLLLPLFHLLVQVDLDRSRWSVMSRRTKLGLATFITYHSNFSILDSVNRICDATNTFSNAFESFLFRILERNSYTFEMTENIFLFDFSDLFEIINPASCILNFWLKDSFKWNFEG